MTDYIERKFPKPQGKFKTIQDKEIDEEIAKIEREVEVMIQRKIREFSFEIKPELTHFPEIDQLMVIIDKSIEEYKIAKKFGQMKESKIYKATIKEMKFAKEHLIRVMNMDFSRPTQKMRDMAEQANINLADPKVIEEFKII